MDVLIAEDEAHIAKLIEFKLKIEGFSVTIAPNGKAAMDLLKTKPWKLIILDVMMPLADGWEVLRFIRAHSEFKGIPVLMLTAKGQTRDQVAAAQLGATRFLKKPFDPAELGRVAKELSGNQGASERG